VEGLQPESTDGWLRVRALRDGRIGWVAARRLAAAADRRIGTDARQTTTVAPADPNRAPPAPAEPATRGAGQVSDSLVFDISHFNGEVDFAAASAAGQRAVVHKATEGSGWRSTLLIR